MPSFSISTLGKAAAATTFSQEIQERGYVVFEDVVDQNLLSKLQNDLQAAEQICHDIQVKNGIDAGMGGTVHHLLATGESFLEYLRCGYFYEEIQGFFGGNFIVNSYGGVLNRKDIQSYVQNVHRDVRSYTKDYRMMLNLLVMLDDFTLENGATYLLAGSHLQPEKPSDEFFLAHADRAVGKAGSLLFFDSRVWHATGKNTTDTVRRALTLTLTPPYFKQQMDYSRTIGYEVCETLPEHLQQMLGYFSRTPSTLDEWYQPPHKRMYRPGQG
jgi:ectoine hydroxylase-related dioxygenase (phytanoyl-CoA dioxygenase family)